jgi:hypothetical protein
MADQSIQEEAYSKASSEVRQNLGTLPRAPDLQGVVQNQEGEDRNMGEGNIPPLAVAVVVERMASRKVQQLRSQNLALHRSAGAKLSHRLLQLGWPRKSRKWHYEWVR